EYVGLVNDAELRISLAQKHKCHDIVINVSRSSGRLLVLRRAEPSDLSARPCCTNCCHQTTSLSFTAESRSFELKMDHWTSSFQPHLNPAEEFLSQTLMRERGRWGPGKFQHECVLMSGMKSPTQFLGRYPHMSLFRTRPGQRQTMRRVSGEILPFR
ncbi:hypothetical protein GOODEAATRI_026761, partial [Goodea atripinnis]